LIGRYKVAQVHISSGAKVFIHPDFYENKLQ